jgi:hypothetical protein
VVAAVTPSRIPVMAIPDVLRGRASASRFQKYGRGRSACHRAGPTALAHRPRAARSSHCRPKAPAYPQSAVRLEKWAETVEGEPWLVLVLHRGYLCLHGGSGRRQARLDALSAGAR